MYIEMIIIAVLLIILISLQLTLNSILVELKKIKEILIRKLQ